MTLNNEELDIKDYKEKIIIFMDILGMKDFGMNKNNNKKLIEFFNKVNNFIKNKECILKDISTGGYKLKIDKKYLNIPDLDFKFNVLSDTIIISFNPKYKFFLPSAIRISRIFYFLSLIDLELPCRGSIVLGDLFISKDNQILFGEGLCKAAEYENDKVGNPDIKIEDALHNSYLTYLDKEFQNDISDLINKGIIECTGSHVIALDNNSKASTVKNLLIKESEEIFRDQKLNIFSDLEHTCSSIGTTKKDLKSICERNIRKFSKQKKLKDIWEYILKNLKNSS